jgi:hypothetical protein
MVDLIKNKIFRTRQLVKESLEDLKDLRAQVSRIEEALAPAGDGLGSWSSDMQGRVRRIFSHLRPWALQGLEKVRLGADKDGGYIVPGDWKKVSRLLSLGVGSENSFDLVFADAGVPVDAYDHTIARLPVEHPLIRWHQKKVDGSAEIPSSCSLDTLLLAEESGGGVALKMDIEGWEYPALLGCAENNLCKARFVVGEFHGLARSIEANQTQVLEATFSKLQKYFSVIHVHANNASGIRLMGGVLVPNLLEITWVNRAHYSLQPSKETFPTALDRPNRPDRCDLWLGSFDFTFPEKL